MHASCVEGDCYDGRVCVGLGGFGCVLLVDVVIVGVWGLLVVVLVGVIGVVGGCWCCVCSLLAWSGSEVLG